jgi:hypothetical protein
VGGGLGGHLSSTSDVASSMSLSALATHNNSSAGALDSQQQGGGGDGGGAGNVPDANGGGVDGDASAALSVLALEPEILVVKYDSVKKVLITAGTDRVVRVGGGRGQGMRGQEDAQANNLGLVNEQHIVCGRQCDICAWCPTVAGVVSPRLLPGRAARGAHRRGGLPGP